MAPNKIENQIKEQLSSREIQPSAQAWDRLDAMLSVAEERKTKRSFGWLYIAASVTVLLLAGMFFFSQESSKKDTQNNVAETGVKDSIQKEENKFQTPINKAEKNKENQVAVSTENQHPKSNNISPNKEAVSVINQKNQKKSINPLINREKQIEFQNSSDVALKDLPKIETRKEIVVYNPKDNKTNAPTDEQLLAGLDKKAKESSNNKSTVQVDARSLLSQVDGELEMTFREKVISKVAKNYKEVKVALVNRNKE